MGCKFTRYEADTFYTPGRWPDIMDALTMYTRHDDDIPGHFHVMERTPKGTFYRAQLMLNSTLGWWLPDCKFKTYAQQLGERVERWYQ